MGKRVYTAISGNRKGEIMTAHELAEILLQLPDEEIFIDVRKIKGLEHVGSMHIETVKLCDCGYEVFIYPDKEES